RGYERAGLPARAAAPRPDRGQIRDIALSRGRRRDAGRQYRGRAGNERRERETYRDDHRQVSPLLRTTAEVYATAAGALAGSGRPADNPRLAILSDSPVKSRPLRRERSHQDALPASPCLVGASLVLVVVRVLDGARPRD